MRFLLADSFTGALARLPTAEAKAVKTTVVDLQIDPTGKGLSFHRIDKSKDANFWSVRVGRDLRLAVRANTSPPLARAPARESRPEIKGGGRPTRSSGGRSTG
jgi:hypothetical protein